MVETLIESERKTPVAADCDICVIGGSATGVFAAVAAARLGADVVLIEKNGFFGGIATAGLVNIWHSLHNTTQEQQIVAGLTQEVLDRLKRRSAVAFGPTDFTYAILNTAELAIELDELVREAGVRPYLDCRFVLPITEEGRLLAAVVEDKTGRRAIRAHYFIDATGDGDLLARAGLPCTKREDLQPPTACAAIYGLEAIRELAPSFNLEEAVFDERFAEALPRGFLWASQMTGVPGISMVYGTRVNGADCSDADQLTQAEMEARRQVRALLDILRRHVPGGDRVALVTLSSSIGIRETRHAECLYTLTEDDVLGGARFADAIANGSYPVDIHHSGQPGVTFRFLDGTEEHRVPGRPPVKRRWRPELPARPTFWQIPYRALVPQGSRNVLVAGRLVSADRGAYGAIRVMISCNQTGQAAGVASYLALQSSAPVGAVDPAVLRNVLGQQGAAIV